MAPFEAAPPFVSKRAELRTILSIGLPSALIVAIRSIAILTDNAIVGHFTGGTGKPTPIYLDASSLALLWMNLTYAMFMRGVGGAVNTLTSQALGAGNNKLAGAWLLTGLGFAAGCAAIVGSLWLVTRDVLGVIVQPPNNATYATGTELAAGLGAPGGPLGNATHPDPVDLAAEFARCQPEHRAPRPRSVASGLAPLPRRPPSLARYSTAWVFPSMLTDATWRWLVAQRVLYPLIPIFICSSLANLGLNVLLVYGVDGVGGIGYIGSPLATLGAKLLGLLGILTFVCRRRATLPLPEAGAWRQAFRIGRLRTFAAQVSRDRRLYSISARSTYDGGHSRGADGAADRGGDARGVFAPGCGRTRRPTRAHGHGVALVHSPLLLLAHLADVRPQPSSLHPYRPPPS